MSVVQGHHVLVLGKDSAIYVLAQGAMTATRYIDDLSTAVEDPSPALALAAYPVPADDQLIIRYPSTGASIVAYTIIDASGRALMNGPLPAGASPVDVSGLMNGAYMLRTNEGRTVRFVVQH